MRISKIHIVYSEILCSLIISFIFWSPLFKEPDRFLYGDFDFFITYLFANKISMLYFKEFPFFSSYIGGGFPLWANPQNMLFSVPQIFSFIFKNQWIAIRVSVLFISVISMTGMFVLFRQLDIKNFFCRLYGAMIYTFSGFLVSHLTAGHFAFHNIAYLPILSAAFIWSWKFKKFAYILPFILALMVYAGSSITNIFIVIFLFSFITFCDFKKWSTYLAFGVLLSAPKLIASYKILSIFPKNCVMGKVSDSFEGIFNTLGTALFGINQKWDLSPYYAKTGLGVHEVNGYIGILCFIFVILGGYYILKHTDYTYRKFALSMALVTATALFLYPGDSNPIWPLLSKNLIIGALHMPTRFVGLLPLPMAYFATVGLYYLSEKNFLSKRINIFFITICLFTFAEYNFVNRRNILLIRRFTFLKSPAHFYADKKFKHSAGPEWKDGTFIDETQIMNSYLQNNEGILRFYDTLLGYSGEAFPEHSSVKEGNLDIFNTDPNI
ncbi:MAG TPA: hypothetical protein DCX95_07745, partial [Elusimicrobia bacterium]|nr:hypothetical protein [Elusimicrobiota bacterium]